MLESVYATLQLGNLRSSSFEFGFDLQLQLLIPVLRIVGEDLEDILRSFRYRQLLGELIPPILELRRKIQISISVASTSYGAGELTKLKAGDAARAGVSHSLSESSRAGEGGAER